METLTANTLGRVRREHINGRSYLVAPVTMIVPGVIPGSKGPLLYVPEDIKQAINQWNNVPLVLDHPTNNGVYISAKTPGVVESVGMGMVKNAHWKDNKLKAEGWFDEEQTKKVHEGVYNNLLNNVPIELSTGLFTTNEPAPLNSSFNGRGYSFTARNHRPDHLAILIDRKGACNIQDGCGVLVNHLVDNSKHTCTCGGSSPVSNVWESLKHPRDEQGQFTTVQDSETVEALHGAAEAVETAMELADKWWEKTEKYPHDHRRLDLAVQRLSDADDDLKEALRKIKRGESKAKDYAASALRNLNRAEIILKGTSRNLPSNIGLRTKEAINEAIIILHDAHEMTTNRAHTCTCKNSELTSNDQFKDHTLETVMHPGYAEWHAKQMAAQRQAQASTSSTGTQFTPAGSGRIWRSEDHPRVPAGSPQGGEFTSASGSDTQKGIYWDSLRRRQTEADLKAIQDTPSLGQPTILEPIPDAPAKVSQGADWGTASSPTPTKETVAQVAAPAVEAHNSLPPSTFSKVTTAANDSFTRIFKDKAPTFVENAVSAAILMFMPREGMAGKLSILGTAAGAIAGGTMPAAAVGGLVGAGLGHLWDRYIHHIEPDEEDNRPTGNAWDEKKHPRDDDGQFAPLYGDAKETSQGAINYSKHELLPLINKLFDAYPGSRRGSDAAGDVMSIEEYLDDIKQARSTQEISKLHKKISKLYLTLGKGLRVEPNLKHASSDHRKKLAESAYFASDLHRDASEMLVGNASTPPSLRFSPEEIKAAQELIKTMEREIRKQFNLSPSGTTSNNPHQVVGNTQSVLESENHNLIEQPEWMLALNKAFDESKHNRAPKGAKGVKPGTFIPKGFGAHHEVEFKFKSPNKEVFAAVFKSVMNKELEGIQEAASERKERSDKGQPRKKNKAYQTLKGTVTGIGSTLGRAARWVYDNPEYAAVGALAGTATSLLAVPTLAAGVVGTSPVSVGIGTAVAAAVAKVFQYGDAFGFNSGRDKGESLWARISKSANSTVPILKVTQYEKNEKERLAKEREALRLKALDKQIGRQLLDKEKGIGLSKSSHESSGSIQVSKTGEAVPTSGIKLKNKLTATKIPLVPLDTSLVAEHGPLKQPKVQPSLSDVAVKVSKEIKQAELGNKAEELARVAYEAGRSAQQVGTKRGGKVDYGLVQKRKKYHEEAIKAHQEAAKAYKQAGNKDQEGYHHRQISKLEAKIIELDSLTTNADHTDPSEGPRLAFIIETLQKIKNALRNASDDVKEQFIRDVHSLEAAMDKAGVPQLSELVGNDASFEEKHPRDETGKFTFLKAFVPGPRALKALRIGNKATMLAAGSLAGATVGGTLGGLAGGIATVGHPVGVVGGALAGALPGAHYGFDLGNLASKGTEKLAITGYKIGKSGVNIVGRGADKLVSAIHGMTPEQKAKAFKVGTGVYQGAKGAVLGSIGGKIAGAKLGTYVGIPAGSTLGTTGGAVLGGVGGAAVGYYAGSYLADKGVKLANKVIQKIRAPKTADPEVTNNEWNADKHPRGQPNNAGQFAKNPSSGQGQSKPISSSGNSEGEEPKPKRGLLDKTVDTIYDTSHDSHDIGWAHAVFGLPVFEKRRQALGHQTEEEARGGNELPRVLRGIFQRMHVIAGVAAGVTYLTPILSRAITASASQTIGESIAGLGTAIGHGLGSLLTNPYSTLFAAGGEGLGQVGSATTASFIGITGGVAGGIAAGALAGYLVHRYAPIAIKAGIRVGSRAFNGMIELMAAAAKSTVKGIKEGSKPKEQLPQPTGNALPPIPPKSTKEAPQAPVPGDMEKELDLSSLPPDQQRKAQKLLALLQDPEERNKFNQALQAADLVFKNGAKEIEAQRKALEMQKGQTPNTTDAQSNPRGPGSILQPLTGNAWSEARHSRGRGGKFTSRRGRGKVGVGTGGLGGRGSRGRRGRTLEPLPTTPQADERPRQPGTTTIPQSLTKPTSELKPTGTPGKTQEQPAEQLKAPTPVQEEPKPETLKMPRTE